MFLTVFTIGRRYGLSLPVNIEHSHRSTRNSSVRIPPVQNKSCVTLRVDAGCIFVSFSTLVTPDCRIVCRFTKHRCPSLTTYSVRQAVTCNFALPRGQTGSSGGSGASAPRRRVRVTSAWCSSFCCSTSMHSSARWIRSSNFFLQSKSSRYTSAKRMHPDVKHKTQSENDVLTRSQRQLQCADPDTEVQFCTSIGLSAHTCCTRITVSLGDLCSVSFHHE